MSGVDVRAPRRVPGASRRISRDRVATAWRRRARQPIRSWLARAAEVRHPYGVSPSAPAPGTPRRPARRPDPRRAAAVRLVIVRPDPAEVADAGQVRDNPAVDPVVIALAQLVRDRWANERRVRVHHRRLVRVRKGDPA